MKKNEEDSRGFSGEWLCARVLDVTSILNFRPPPVLSPTTIVNGYHGSHPFCCHLYVASRVLYPLRTLFFPSKIAAPPKCSPTFSHLC